MTLYKVDKILIGFLILIFTYSAYRLTKQSTKTLSLLDFESIGSISSLENNVKKRNVDSLNWFNVSKGEQISNNDYLFTGNDSNVFITFNNGNSAVINKNSIVLVGNMKDSNLLEIEKGSISTNTKLPLTINTTLGNRKVSFSATGMIDLTSQNDKLNIDVISGTLKDLYNKDIKAFSQGDRVSISQKLYDIKKSKFTNIEVTTNNHNLEITWDYDKGSDFEIHFLGEMKNKLHSTIVENKSISVPIDKRFHYFQLSAIKDRVSSIITPIHHNSSKSFFSIDYGEKISLITEYVKNLVMNSKKAKNAIDSTPSKKIPHSSQ